MREIQKRDRRAVRQIVIVLAASLVLALIAVAVVGHYRPALEDWIDEDPAARLRTLALLGSLGMLPFAAAATYMFRLGYRILQAERFPPPGTAVVRDTVVLRGRAARRRGLLLQALAVFLLLATATGIALMLRLVSGPR
jgi:hypothetical protein